MKKRRAFSAEQGNLKRDSDRDGSRRDSFLSIGPSFFFERHEKLDSRQQVSDGEKKRPSLSMRASVQCNISFESVSRAIHTTHTDMRRKKSRGRTHIYSRLPRRAWQKRTLAILRAPGALKDTAKGITVEYHVRNRAIASTNSRFSNASIDREAAPLSPKLPCLPRWTAMFGRSCTLKNNEKKEKNRSRLKKKPSPSCLT